MMKFILLALYILVTEVLTYKFIRHIDFKERKRVLQYEKAYINDLIELKKQVEDDQECPEELDDDKNNEKQVKTKKKKKTKKDDQQMIVNEDEEFLL